MKKLIAILLILLMVFSLVACKNDDPTIPSKPLKPLPTKPLPTKPTEPTTPAESRQEELEKIFTEGTFVVNANSFKISVGDIVDIVGLTDTNGKCYFGVSGTIDGEETGATLYQHSDSIVYFHQFGNGEGQTIDKWYKCNIASIDSEDIFNTTESGVANVNDFLDALNQIEKIEYVESIDGVDYVNIHYLPTNEEYEGWTIIYDATFNVELYGQSGEFRYTTRTLDDGSGTILSWHWTKEIEGVDLLEWRFDPKTMILVKDNLIVDCVLVEDHIKNPGKQESMIMRVAINSTTNEILIMSMIEDGVVTSIEFISGEDVSIYVELPEYIDGKMALEEASTELTMTALAIIMANANIG